MDRRQLNYNWMLGAVRGVLASHETDKTWTQIPALVTAVEELDAVAISISEHFEASASPDGSSASKTSAFDTLVTTAHEVAAGLHACATKAGNDELAAQVDYSLSDMADGREADVIARCANVLTLANANVDALGDYNLTQAKLTGLGRKLEAYKQAQPKPRLNQVKKSAVNDTLPHLISEARTILTRRVDRLMVQFRKSAPEFYAEYQAARKIVNQPGGQGGNQAAKVLPASTGVSIPKAA